MTTNNDCKLYCISSHSLGQDVELPGHLCSEFLLLESVSVAYDSAQILKQSGDVGQQQPGALS